MPVDPSRKPLLQRLGLDVPILLAPMAGSGDATLAIAVAQAGGLGAIPCATLSPAQIEAEVARFRAALDAPLNLNFFAHRSRVPDAAEVQAWREVLQPLHAELGLDVPDTASAGRQPFDADAATLVEALRPQVVSFHFGLPEAPLLDRVRATGALVFSTATTVAEARWLAAHGVDAVIAQGWEAGGHRGMFLDTDIDAQVGTLALVPQIVDAVEVPVIAAGGIADGRGVAAALMLGADAAQLGTAFLRSPQVKLAAAYRRALEQAHDDATRLTNLFTGRPARGLRNTLMDRLGPMSSAALPFPYAGSLLTALRERSVREGDSDFINLWAGQAAALARDDDAGAITRNIAEQAAALLE